MGDESIPVGVIGFGAVGRELVRRLAVGEVPGHHVAGVFTRDEGPSSLPPADLYCATFEALLARAPAVVVEAASLEALAELGPQVLAAGCDLLPLSVSGFADRAIEERLFEALRASRGRIYMPSGAVAGLDAVSAARFAGLEEVTLVQRKPPRSLLPPEEVDALKSERVLYEGTARDAALKFPRNSNIAAALGLAGAGLDATRVKVVADPTVTRNTAEVTARGPWGELHVRLSNVPSDNPRTSRLTCLSVMACLSRRAARRIIPA